MPERDIWELLTSHNWDCVRSIELSVQIEQIQLEQFGIQLSRKSVVRVFDLTALWRLGRSDENLEKKRIRSDRKRILRAAEFALSTFKNSSISYRISPREWGVDFEQLHGRMAISHVHFDDAVVEERVVGIFVRNEAPLFDERRKHLSLHKSKHKILMPGSFWYRIWPTLP